MALIGWKEGIEVNSKPAVEVAGGLFAFVTAASFNNVMAGLGALVMGAYYGAKLYYLIQAKRNDSEAPFPGQDRR